jgi:hypothetical protein
MKKRFVVFTILIVGVLLLGWWFLRGTAQHATSNTTLVPDASSMITQGVTYATTNSQSIVVPSKVVRIQTTLGTKTVRLFKSTNYPPQTAVGMVGCYGQSGY